MFCTFLSLCFAIDKTGPQSQAITITGSESYNFNECQFHDISNTAVYFQSTSTSSSNFRSCIFNTCSSTSNEGGAILVKGDVTIHVDKACISNCHAQNGAAFHYNHGDTKYQHDKCSLDFVIRK